MQINEFKRIVRTFSDPGEEMLCDSERIVMSVNGDTVEARVHLKDGEVFVKNSSNDLESAARWIQDRLARLPMLASRLKDTIHRTEFFVPPAGTLVPKISKSINPDHTLPLADAQSKTIELLDDRSALETTVLYITSDAGEGKTSLINESAYRQAVRFLSKESDWLLVPISLGGRHFLRFDDITIGALQNRYRFSSLYYDSFLEMVKMGVIVPAFDGFEEMFVESGSGEALSAMGSLVESLDSSGSIVIAARKAYFDFENLNSQAKLFDTIKNYSVGFAKIEISRWTESNFIQYCQRRNISNSKDIYSKAETSLGRDHALLTRAVLANKLVDVAEECPSVDDLVEQIRSSGPDFFSVFVKEIIQREATEKWIDRSGTDGISSALLTTNEHCELLSHVAIAMWESRTSYLKYDALSFAAEYYCEIADKSAYQTSQISQRVKGHALLIPSTSSDNAVEFDHDEFRFHFLGEGIASIILSSSPLTTANVGNILRRGVLPQQAIESLVKLIARHSNDQIRSSIKFLLGVAKSEGQATFTHENCGSLIIMLLERIDEYPDTIAAIAFSHDSLKSISLRRVRFEDCYFSQSSLSETILEDVTFENCRFGVLRFDETTSVDAVKMLGCTVEAVATGDPTQELWDPLLVAQKLSRLGVDIGESSNGEASRSNEIDDPAEYDSEIIDIQKIIRYFMRSTHISESVIKIKLGARGAYFISGVIPELLDLGILQEIENLGGNDQKRFKLAISLQQLTKAISSSRGSYTRFKEHVSSLHR